MASPISINSQDVLLAIDLQADFMPGGALAVDGGDEIVPLVNRLASRFEQVVVTQDWHPPGHASFASSHEGAKPIRDKAARIRRPDLVARPLRAGNAGRRAPRRSCARPRVPDSAQGHASRNRFLFRLRRGRRQDDDRPCGAAQGPRGETGFRLRPGDRLLRRPFGAGRARRGLRRLRDRGCVPGDRRQQFAERGLGAHERRRSLAHPVNRNPRPVSMNAPSAQSAHVGIYRGEDAACSQIGGTRVSP